MHTDSFGQRLREASDSELLRVAMDRGVDPVPHLCGCEVCSHTSTLCPATRSSLMMAIEEAASDLGL